MTCCDRLITHLKSRIIQSRARANYRLSRWRASRARRKWVKREIEHRREMEIFVARSGTFGEIEGSQSLFVGNYPQKNYRPVTWMASEENRIEWMKTGVSVLSPQRLSERLSENALAREAVGESDLELAQYLKDERIALFLQNDEFISELRSNKDFMTALQREHDGDETELDDEYEDGGLSYRTRRQNSKVADGGGGTIPPLDDATFKERLANMGKASRKKFAQIAKVFSRGKRATMGRSLLPNVGGSSASANGKDLLMSTDPLIDDFDDDRIQTSGDVILSTSPKHRS
ncbi:CUE domain-containing protein 1 [Armadillidium vulgare]|nr:CUE domain-containing protein 1 [Armadillidium vulgare]